MINLWINSLASYVSMDNITLLGDAMFQENGKICLTSSTSSSSLPSSSIGVGRALYRHPIRFHDPSTVSTASFIAQFSFQITPFSDSSSSPPLFGDGFTFIITTNPYTVGKGFGYIGLSNQNSHQDGMYFAVEFDTSFDPSFEDTSGNHIGINVNSVVSFHIIDSTPESFDLKNGKKTTVWIEYTDSRKMVNVWISYTESRTNMPVLTAHMDLSVCLKQFMFIGFTASNGMWGSAEHAVEKWKFRTYGILNSFGTEVEGGCLICVPDDVVQDTAELPLKTSKKNELALGFLGGVFLFFVSVGMGWFFMKKKVVGDIENANHQPENIELNPNALLPEEIAPARGVLRGRNQGKKIRGTAFMYRMPKHKQSIKHPSTLQVPQERGTKSLKDLKDSVERCAQAEKDAQTALISCQSKITAVQAIKTVQRLEKQLKDNSEWLEETLITIELRYTSNQDKQCLQRKANSLRDAINSKILKIEDAKMIVDNSDIQGDLLNKSDDALSSILNEETSSEKVLIKQLENRRSELSKAQSKLDKFINPKLEF